MQKCNTLIFGTGIGGLSVAAKIKESGNDDFAVIERNKEFVKTLQNGLHYLHSVDFALPFEFEFKKVILTEEIWNTKTNTFKKSATIPEMFEYSGKLMENMRHPSSIMDPGKNHEVWLPIENNMDAFLQAYYDYIDNKKFIFDCSLESIDLENKVATVVTGHNDKKSEIEYENLITTIPLPFLFDILGWKKEYEFKNKELYITNYTAKNIVPNWLLVFYMFDKKFPTYRMAVLNNIISMESMAPLTHDDEVIIKYLIDDLLDYDLDSKNAFEWNTGRIFGLQKDQREKIVRSLIDENIFSIGRYGLWNGKVRMDDTILQSESVVKYIKGSINSEDLIKILI